MIRLEQALYGLGWLDRLGFGDSPLHRLDPAAKLLVVVAFGAAVVSFPRYEIAGLVPFIVFPVIFVSLARVPLRPLLTRIALAAPFALGVGLFNPLLDRTPVVLVPGVVVAGGWISFASIVVKVLLTVSMALLLVATTSFPAVCHGMSHLRFPRAFVLQLMLLYRFAFLLAEEGLRLLRARASRGWRRRDPGPRTFSALIASLYLRASGRSERIYRAMCSRGFEGKVPILRHHHFGLRDLGFLAGSVLLIVLLRVLPLARLAGAWLTGAPA